MKVLLILSSLLMALLTACGDNAITPTSTLVPAATVSPTAFSSPTALPTDTQANIPITSSTVISENSPTIEVTILAAPTNSPIDTVVLTTPTLLLPTPTTRPSTPNPSRSTPTTLPPTPIPTATSVPPKPTTTQPVANKQVGYLQAKVVAGPTCPVQRADQPCPPRPVAGRAVNIKNAQGNKVQTVTTDKDGAFKVQLPPGKYQLDVATSGIERVRNNPQVVTIVAGQTSSLQIELDTGIR